MIEIVYFPFSFMAAGLNIQQISGYRGRKPSKYGVLDNIRAEK